MEGAEDLLVDSDREDTLIYDVRVTKHVMASTAQLVTYIACIATNNQCSATFGQFTFDNIVLLQFDSVKILHDTIIRARYNFRKDSL